MNAKLKSIFGAEQVSVKSKLVGRLLTLAEVDTVVGGDASCGGGSSHSQGGGSYTQGPTGSYGQGGTGGGSYNQTC